MSLVDEVLEIHQPKYGHASDPCVNCGDPVPCKYERLALSLRAAEKVVAWARQIAKHSDGAAINALAAALAEYDKGGQG